MKLLVLVFCLCNIKVIASITTHCNECHADAGPGDDLAKCNSELEIQNCTAPSIDSCYTLVTRYQRLSAPDVIHTGVLRGCVYCPSKAAACEAINTWFNANQGINLLDCNIECCSGDKCNNHNLTLYPLTTSAPPMVVTTGTGTSKSPTTEANASNATQCHGCFGDDLESCNIQQSTQTCKSHSGDSCFAATGRYRLNNAPEDVYVGTVRGCITCTNKSTACEAVITWFNAQPQNRIMLDCNIECCTDDRCNDKPVPVLPVDPPDDSTDATPTGSNHASSETPTTIILALAVTRFLGAFFF